MKTRIIVAVVAVPLLLAVVIFAPLWAMGVVVAAISACSAWELMRAAFPNEKKRHYAYPAVSAAILPLTESLGWGEKVYLPLTLALFLVVFIDLMMSFRPGQKRENFSLSALSLMAGLVMPLLLSSIVRLGLSGRGAPYVLLPFVAAFVSDSGAYFVGRALGKHKLAPELSPNKTVEGSAGGFVCAILGMLIYGLVLKALGYGVNFILLALYGFFGSLACQTGDLLFSAIKRETGIKDYGDLIPGHGGMLDRFDSMHTTAPVIELIVLIAPAISI